MDGRMDACFPHYYTDNSNHLLTLIQPPPPLPRVHMQSNQTVHAVQK